MVPNSHRATKAAGTILLVDDERDLRETLAEDFEHQGYQVIRAEGGNEALKMLAQSPVDLIVSDLRMPKGDGADLLKRLRTVKPSPPPVIFMTGYSDVDEMDMNDEAVKAVLHKPFRRIDLFDAVEKVLGKSGMH